MNAIVTRCDIWMNTHSNVFLHQYIYRKSIFHPHLNNKIKMNAHICYYSYVNMSI